MPRRLRCRRVTTRTRASYLAPLPLLGTASAAASRKTCAHRCLRQLLRLMFSPALFRCTQNICVQNICVQERRLIPQITATSMGMPALVQRADAALAGVGERTWTTDLKANHSGMSSPARSALRNLVPDRFSLCSPSRSATSAVT
jgi:hypothetical protein